MRNILVVGGIIFILALGCWFLTQQEPVSTGPVACTAEAMICPDGSAVGRTGPNCEFAPCPEVPTPVADDLIVIDTPTPNERISSPITISGKARGTWFFEASFPIVIVNWDGLIIGEGIATAQSDWMTTEFVPFTATITYTLDPATPYDRGAIILKKDNPSGLPEHDDAREIPIFFTRP